MEPVVTLSILEHYLLHFLRYPLAAPDRRVSAVSTISGVNVHRITTTTTVAGAAMQPAARESFGDKLYFRVFGRILDYFLPHQPDGERSIAMAGHTNESELFLRLLISIWLDSRALLIPTGKVVRTVLERRQHVGLDNSDLSSIFDLNSSFDVTQLPGNYEQLPSQAQKCLLVLTQHVILDPLLHQYSHDINAAKEHWRLTPCMSILQYSMYNFIRTSLRYDSVHSAGSAFYVALNLWLLWCEPWNVTSQGTLGVFAVVTNFVLAHVSCACSRIVVLI